MSSQIVFYLISDGKRTSLLRCEMIAKRSELELGHVFESGTAWSLVRSGPKMSAMRCIKTNCAGKDAAHRTRYENYKRQRCSELSLCVRSLIEVQRANKWRMHTTSMLSLSHVFLKAFEYP